MNNKLELLPIGSVVRLKGAKKDLMIFGVCQTKKDSKKEFDYIGVVWPEGNLGANTQVLFNHDDIDAVNFIGYDTPERKDFIERLHAFYETAK